MSTQKTYISINGQFQEDQNGHIAGLEFTENGIQRRVIAPYNFDSISRRYGAQLVHEWLDGTTWKRDNARTGDKQYSMYATTATFLDTSTGQLVDYATAHEEINGEMVIKSGYMDEATYFESQFAPDFVPLFHSKLSAKFPDDV